MSSLQLEMGKIEEILWRGDPFAESLKKDGRTISASAFFLLRKGLNRIAKYELISHSVKTAESSRSELGIAGHIY